MVEIIGLVLAGGLSRRMGGGDKSLNQLGGQSILSRIIDLAKPQVSELLLNANGDPDRFEEYGLPVVPDVIEGYAGPLAGVLTGLEWLSQNRPQCKWLATFPSDAPFMPTDLISRLWDAMDKEGAQLACAITNGRTHPVVGLWPVALKEELRKAMVEEEMRKIDLWTARYKLVEVDFSCDPVDPFFNANRPEDFGKAEELLALLEGKN
ncbi:MAG: molybdenum cofactor guanylyltransferase MobA [Alphaproteobacteria bacterium]|nr:molybdenum cofactor guanylyltransferase MobA [Rhodospirillales bacterium]MCW9044915.1 molybdenum cofactor guanylyltransferase MobA [Alphaproteobacteria bacterium]